MDRRDFFKAGAGLAIGTMGGMSLLGAGNQPAAAAVPPPDFPTDHSLLSLDHLQYDFFRHHVGHTFEVKCPQRGNIPLKLTRVEMAPQRHTHDSDGVQVTDAFSVIFEGPAQAPLAQGTYTFSNGALGTSALFMVPVFSTNPRVALYQVTFNRLVGKARRQLDEALAARS